MEGPPSALSEAPWRTSQVEEEASSLGARLQYDGTDEADVLVQTTFSSLTNICYDHRLFRTLKLRTYGLAVCSTLARASEGWTLSSQSLTDPVNGDALHQRLQQPMAMPSCLHIITGEDYRV